MAHPGPLPEPTPDHRRPGSPQEGMPPAHCPHWPGAVCPPASPGFEQSAKDWLFELAPARWWHEEMLHRYPVELARMVRLRLEADVMAMHAGLRAVTRSVLPRGPVPAPVPQASELYAREREWASAMLEQVKLVEGALRTACARTRRRRPSAAGPAHPTMPRQRPATG
ncbi:hypothetical protein ACIQGZ_16495 [Streptomyces sp. NPDC092296]|uniref:hypothetical protein n=1 Tax=Streptomyces sp. NPDC092296 TaxID=3366012 RepID=UPI003805708F